MLKLPAIISDGMIIERNAKVWGYIDAGCDVTLTFRGQIYKTTAGCDGCFEITFDAGTFGGPYELIINNIIIRDVMVGYVWLCGGQSNMELPIARVRRMFESELKDVNLPSIRAFIVPKAYVFGDDSEDCDGIWRKATNENIDGFYATAYFFAKQLYERYNVPLGLVCCAAGGCAAESWLSPKALEKFPEYENEYLKWAAENVKDVERAEEAKMREWFNELDAQDPGIKGEWQNPEFDDTNWSERELTDSWEKDLNINGSVWFRKAVVVPEDMANCGAVLELGVVVDSDFVYINGKFVGRIEYRYPPSIFKLPKGALKPGENIIAVRVLSHNGVGGFVYGKPYRITAGGKEVSLLGKWKYQIGGATRPMPDVTPFYKKPTGLYNGMLKQVIKYNITGAAWYQGETNAGYPDNYARIMETLISEWRGIWGKNLPFIFVQLANYEENPGGTWAKLRDKQREALNLPNTAMAVAIDCGEYNDLHPLDKKTVGERLALAARAIAYGEDVIYSGPMAKTAKFKNGEITIDFDFAENGLKTKDGNAPQCFEVETEYGGVFKADAKIEGGMIKIHCHREWRPKYVRYAWDDNPKANLYNMEGLPAVPFNILTHSI